MERRKVPVMSHKTTARAGGVLFIIATVAGAASAAVLGSILETEGLLDTVAANEAKVLAAVFLDLVLVGAVVAISVGCSPSCVSTRKVLPAGTSWPGWLKA